MMNPWKEKRGNSIYLLIFAFSILSYTYLFAEDSQSVYPDNEGRQAFQLWNEREIDRFRAEAARRFWDCWPYYPSYYYTAYRNWLHLEQTQKWMEDPEHYPLPLFVPMSRYSYGYPSPFYPHTYLDRTHGISYCYRPPPWVSYPYPYPYKHKKLHRKIKGKQ